MTKAGLFRLNDGREIGYADKAIELTGDYICTICHRKFYLKKYRNGLYALLAVIDHMRVMHPQVAEVGFGERWIPIMEFKAPPPSRQKPPDRRTTEQLIASEPIGMGNWYMEDEGHPERGRFLFRLQIVRMNSRRVVMKSHEGKGLVTISPPSFVEVELPPCDMTPSIKADDTMKAWDEAMKAGSTV